MNGTKTIAGLSVFLATLVIALPGCGSKEESVPASKANDPMVAAAIASRPTDPVDMTQFLKAFESADASAKLYADEAVAVIRARAFRDAFMQLQGLSRNPSLTPEQRQAVADLMQKLQNPGR